jgi:hypothetical protein
VNVAPGPTTQLLYTVHPHYTHIWDLNVSLTLKHYVVLFGVVWILRSRLAMWMDDGERRERRRFRRTGSRYRPGQLDQNRRH